MDEAELHAIVLAAGGSSRLGRAKQLLEFRGEALVRRAARLLTDITPSVSVVTGARFEQVSEVLAGLPVNERHNARWREGIGGSIALAVQDFGPGTQAVLIMLCDQYLVDAQDLEQLVQAWRRDPGRICAAQWERNFGPPVIFPARFFPGLARLRGDLGARQLLVEERARVNFIDLPNAAFDVDDAEDLAQMRRWSECRPGED